MGNPTTSYYAAPTKHSLSKPFPPFPFSVHVYQPSSINRRSVQIQYSPFSPLLDLRSKSPSRASMAPEHELGICSCRASACNHIVFATLTLRNKVQSRKVIAVRKSCDVKLASSTPTGSSCCCSCFSRCRSGDFGIHLMS